jgi:hypothetical protein
MDTGLRGPVVQQLTEGMQKAIQSYTDFETDERPEHEAEFRRAAEQWAANSLRVFDGVLLQKALAISCAMAEFLNEMEKKEALAK